MPHRYEICEYGVDSLAPDKGRLRSNLEAQFSGEVCTIVEDKNEL